MGAEAIKQAPDLTPHCVKVDGLFLKGSTIAPTEFFNFLPFVKKGLGGAGVIRRDPLHLCLGHITTVPKLPSQGDHLLQCACVMLFRLPQQKLRCGRLTTRVEFCHSLGTYR